MENIKSGISIIAKYTDENKDITPFLKSIENQTLTYNSFEILIIINKENENLINQLLNYSKTHHYINIKIIEIDNFSSYLKQVITYIGYEYTLFVDVTDTLSSNYLRTLLKNSSKDKIVLGKLCCYSNDKIIETEESSFINKFDELVPNEKLSEELFLRIVNKLIHSSYLLAYVSNENLNVFDETDFLISSISKNDLDFFVVDSTEEANYNLILDVDKNDNYNVSYKTILENLKVLKSLDYTLEKTSNEFLKKVINFIIYNKYLDLILNYLEVNPQNYKKIINLLKQYKIYFKYEKYLKKGICVLTPCYKAEIYIDTFLESMYNQTLDYDLFEILIIINGERDNTESIIQNFKKQHPEINIRVIESEKGATTARNKGIDEIQHPYVVFVDVDDFLSPNYLKTLYTHATLNRIVIGQFYDQDEKTKELQKTYFTDSLIKNQGIVDPNNLVTGAILNAANKLMPSKYVKKIKFDQTLRSGDDLDYFCRLYANTDFEFYVVNPKEDAYYYRLVVSNSVSRQGMSYDFNIIQRLEAMKAIDNTLINIKNKKVEKILLSAINDGQGSFIISYLRKFPEDYENVLKDLKRYNIKNFNYDIFNYL